MSLDDRELVFVATGEELERIAAFLRTLERVRSVRLVHRDGSPWIELDVVFGPEVARPFHELEHHELDEYGVQRFALWRYTLALHRVDDGAVGDDPLEGWGPLR